LKILQESIQHLCIPNWAYFTLFRKQQKHGYLSIKTKKQVEVLLSRVSNTDLPVMNSCEGSIADWTSACLTTVIWHPFHRASQKLLFWSSFTENRMLPPNSSLLNYVSAGP